MSHIQWVVRQNKLEIPRGKDEVNRREIHECDGREYDPTGHFQPCFPASSPVVCPNHSKLS
jgi:hypothetical protein